MIERLWVQDESRLRKVLLSPLLPFEALYRFGTWCHRSAYRLGLRQAARLPNRVVAVGNLRVGGSGKTPFAGWLAAELANMGHKVAILSRGVGGSLTGRVNVVSDGERLLRTPGEVGDEPVMLAASVPRIPVLAGRNRKALGLRAAALFGAEVVLLDDGFQHHRVAHDLDLVCIDAVGGLGNGHVLPRGPLREASSVLRLADAVIWTRVPEEEWTPPLELPGALPQFRVRMLPRELRPIGGEGAEPLDGLSGRDVGVVAAIARPEAFCQVLTKLGARVKSVRAFRDHHRYTPAEIASLDPALRWVTTAKDAVKIPPAWLGDVRIDVLEEEVQSPDRAELLEWLEQRLGPEG